MIKFKESELNIINPHLDILLKININLLKSILINKFYVDNFSIELTYAEMGLDDLDSVELIMELEKQLGIAIDDNVVEIIFSYESSPMDLIELHKLNRELKLKKLGLKW